MELTIGTWARPLPSMTPYIFLQTEIYNMGVSISKHIPCISDILSKSGSHHAMPCPSMCITSRQKYVGTQEKFLCNSNTHAVHSKVAFKYSVARSKSYISLSTLLPIIPCYTGHVYT